MILVLTAFTDLDMVNICFCLCHFQRTKQLLFFISLIALPPCCCDDRKIMVMPRTSMNTPDKHGQKNLGFFLQCNGETDSQLVSNVTCYSYSCG